tara:strand:+ start:598 stop:1344 length:747 start_codon:yes stop_codon:yes gene_type:complete
MNLEQNLANIKSEEYTKYLELYSNFHQERVKCLKRKNCDDKYIETPNDLKIVKGSKEKKIVKPKYIFVDERMKNINIELRELEQEIRNFRFIVESDSSKKIADAFADVKKKYLEKTNEKNELQEYLKRVNSVEENREKKIEINVQILEEQNIKRELYFQICALDKENEERKELIKEYLDNENLLKLKKELKKLENTDTNYIVETLPRVTKSPVKKTEEEPKKKKAIKRCPKGQKKDKKTGECVKKEEK